MRVNIYAEEITQKIAIIEKLTPDGSFTGLRFYLELPVTIPNAQGTGVTVHKGPFMHHAGDDDSSAVTFWGKRDLREVLRTALALLDSHYRAMEEKRA